MYVCVYVHIYIYIYMYICMQADRHIHVVLDSGGTPCVVLRRAEALDYRVYYYYYYHHYYYHYY